MTLISTACSWVSILGGQKAAIIAQVGQFYFDEVGQYYSGANIYRAALEAGGKDNGAPGLRPQYHANYYAAFVIGPDGHNIEVVCHKPETASFP